MAQSAKSSIDNFLAQKRIAFVGVSRDPKDFSRGLFRDLSRRGYDVVPVNPQAQEVEGRPCFARVQDIDPPVQGALLMTSPAAAQQVVQDCAQAGIKRIWLYRGAGQGAVSPAALNYCREHGLEVVPGHCPYMFFPETEFIHRAHGFVLKLFGHYPQ